MSPSNQRPPFNSILLASVCLIPLLACGGENGGGEGGSNLEPAWQSGSRLRARVYDGGGGAQLFISWFDTQLGSDCEFLQAMDGSTRCLPPIGTVDSGLFADPACTQPVVPLSSSQPVANESARDYRRAFRVPASSTCDRQGPFGIKVVDGEPSFAIPYISVGGGCMQIGLASSGMRIWLGQVRDGDPGAFVSGQEMVAPGGPLAVRVMVGDDGSRENFGLFDVARAAPCVPAGSQLAGASPVCIPSVEVACPRTPQVGCDTNYQFAAPSSAGDNACPVISGVACDPANVVADGFYAKASVRRVGTGRLRADVFTDSSGRPIHNLHAPGAAGVGWPVRLPPAYAFFDTTLGTTCSQMGEPGFRCLPDPGTTPADRSVACDSFAFTDATCSTPIYLRCPDGMNASCPDDLWVDVVTSEENFYRIGPPRAVTQVWRGSPGACTRDDDAVAAIAAGSTIARALQTPTPLPALATAVERTE